MNGGLGEPDAHACDNSLARVRVRTSGRLAIVRAKSPRRKFSHRYRSPASVPIYSPAGIDGHDLGTSGSTG
ncbi:MAG: hypothetical protein U0Q11_08355 [Vicinamibacterales bacterium]